MRPIQLFLSVLLLCYCSLSLSEEIDQLASSKETLDNITVVMDLDNHVFSLFFRSGVLPAIGYEKITEPTVSQIIAIYDFDTLSMLNNLTAGQCISSVLDNNKKVRKDSTSLELYSSLNNALLGIFDASILIELIIEKIIKVPLYMSEMKAEMALFNLAIRLKNETSGLMASLSRESEALKKEIQSGGIIEFETVKNIVINWIAVEFLDRKACEVVNSAKLDSVDGVLVLAANTIMPYYGFAEALESANNTVKLKQKYNEMSSNLSLELWSEIDQETSKRLGLTDE